MITRRPDLIRQLTQAGVDETVENLFLKSKLLEKILKFLFVAPSRRFAVKTDEFDQRIPLEGMPQASYWLLHQFIGDLTVEGVENLPAEGPLLILANHAGGVDFLGVLASVNRPDICLLANEHAVLRGAKNADQHIMYITPAPEDRPAAIFSVINKLREGKPVIIFPTGMLEPDPAIIPGAQHNLDTWSPSIGIFLKKVPETRLVPVLISGSLAEGFYNLPFVRKRATVKSRAKTALLLQYMAQMAGLQPWPVHLRVQFGKPCTLADLTTSEDVNDIAAAIIQKEKDLMGAVFPKSTLPLINWQ